MMQTIEIHEIRKMLVAIETLAVRPGQADATTLGEAIGYFAKLVSDRTQGLIEIKMIVEGVAQ